MVQNDQNSVLQNHSKGSKNKAILAIGGIGVVGAALFIGGPLLAIISAAIFVGVGKAISSKDKVDELDYDQYTISQDLPSQDKSLELLQEQFKDALSRPAEQKQNNNNTTLSKSNTESQKITDPKSVLVAQTASERSVNLNGEEAKKESKTSRKERSIQREKEFNFSGIGRAEGLATQYFENQRKIEESDNWLEEQEANKEEVCNQYVNKLVKIARNEARREIASNELNIAEKDGSNIEEAKKSLRRKERYGKYSHTEYERFKSEYILGDRTPYVAIEEIVERLSEESEEVVSAAKEFLLNDKDKFNIVTKEDLEKNKDMQDYNDHAYNALKEVKKPDRETGCINDKALETANKQGQQNNSSRSNDSSSVNYFIEAQQENASISR